MGRKPGIRVPAGEMIHTLESLKQRYNLILEIRHPEVNADNFETNFRADLEQMRLLWVDGELREKYQELSADSGDPYKTSWFAGHLDFIPAADAPDLAELFKTDCPWTGETLGYLALNTWWMYASWGDENTFWNFISAGSWHSFGTMAGWDEEGNWLQFPGVEIRAYSLYLNRVTMNFGNDLLFRPDEWEELVEHPYIQYVLEEIKTALAPFELDPGLTLGASSKCPFRVNLEENNYHVYYQGELIPPNHPEMPKSRIEQILNTNVFKIWARADHDEQEVLRLFHEGIDPTEAGYQTGEPLDDSPGQAT